MEENLTQILSQALQKEGYLSLKEFYERHPFSFSYEYLRQIFAGEKIPQDKKLLECSKALKLNFESVQKTASTLRLAQKLRGHYKLPQAPVVPKRFSEKIKHYQTEGDEEAKLVKWIRQLGKKEKEQLTQYVKFLKRQCRPPHKKRKT